MVEHDDEAIHRLRASDPATGSHPDLHRLRGLIAQKAPASQGADRATAVDDELLRGPRLRTPWVAAAAVAALGLGAGGYALGVQQADTVPPTADGTSRQVGPASQGEDPASGADASGPADLPGQAAADQAEEDMDAMAGVGQTEASMDGDFASSGPAWDPGPVRLTAGEGLPGSPGTAEVLVRQSDMTPEEFVAAYAAATGFEGEPLPESEYLFGPGYAGAGLIDVDDGLMITVNADGGALHFSYEDIYGSGYCSQMYEGVPDEDLQMMREDWARSYGPDLPFPSTENCREITGERPSEEAAKAAASDFFAQAGVDVSGFTFSAWADDYEGSRTVSVDAQPEDMVGAGDLMLSATVGPDGVVTAYGSLGELVSLGEYPVISAADAVERFGTREFSMEYGVSIAEDNVPMTEEDWDTFEMPEWTLPESRPLQPGDRIPMLLKDKLVTGAELVRGSLWSQTAGSVEVPVWKLMTEDGMYYPVLALAEEAIEFQTWE